MAGDAGCRFLRTRPGVPFGVNEVMRQKGAAPFCHFLHTCIFHPHFYYLMTTFPKVTVPPDIVKEPWMVVTPEIVEKVLS